MKIDTLQQFYELMHQTKNMRESIVSSYYNGQKSTPKEADFLKKALHALEDIPKAEGKHVLSLQADKRILLDITYEREELEKDIYFLEHSEEEFYHYLEQLPNREQLDFVGQRQECQNFLENISFQNFITDRDGTVNNYCGRYKSSIQSIYNAVFLTRFAHQCVDNAIILTSAPLDNIGLIDISTNPKNTFIYAGSKGREYINKQGIRGQLPIVKEEQNRLHILNKKLTQLVRQQEYEMFSLIGSGLQFKFGQTTISRQDIYNSISIEESDNFLTVVKDIIRTIDPENRFFRIEDTGLDIEIILTFENADKAEAFDKGDGVYFLNEELNLHIEKGPNLICGDTKSDVSMVAASVKKTSDTWSVFVTKDTDLQQEVRAICPHSFFVSEPDILVSVLNNLSNR